MAEPSDANKRQKPEDAVPAFSDTISNFAVEETLRFEAGGRLAVVLGTLDARSADEDDEFARRLAIVKPDALREYPHLLVLPSGDRTLLAVLQGESLDDDGVHETV